MTAILLHIGNASWENSHRFHAGSRCVDSTGIVEATFSRRKMTETAKKNYPKNPWDVMGCQKHRTFFEAPGVSLGGSGVSIGRVKILRVTCNWKLLMFNRNDLQMMDVPLSIYLSIYLSITMCQFCGLSVPLSPGRPAGKCLSACVSKYQSNYYSYP